MNPIDDFASRYLDAAVTMAIIIGLLFAAFYVVAAVWWGAYVALETAANFLFVTIPTSVRIWVLGPEEAERRARNRQRNAVQEWERQQLIAAKRAPVERGILIALFFTFAALWVYSRFWGA